MARLCGVDSVPGRSGSLNPQSQDGICSEKTMFSAWSSDPASIGFSGSARPRIASELYALTFRAYCRLIASHRLSNSCSIEGFALHLNDKIETAIMKRLSVLTLLLALNSSLHAITFDLVFDNDPTPGIQAPIVGTGAFTFANDPGNGTFPFATLGAFSLTFSFFSGASIFTQSDIVSDLSLATVVLSTSGASRILQFSDTGFGSGPFGGSLDLVNPSGEALSFEPSYAGAGLRLYQGATVPAFLFGDYSAVNGVPESGSTIKLLGYTAVALVFARRFGKRLRNFSPR